MILGYSKCSERMKFFLNIAIYQFYSKDYKIDLINPPSTRMEAPLVAEASGLEK